MNVFDREVPGKSKRKNGRIFSNARQRSVSTKPARSCDDPKASRPSLQTPRRAVAPAAAPERRLVILPELAE
jgi:hypothetical protein